MLHEITTDIFLKAMFHCNGRQKIDLHFGMLDVINQTHNGKIYLRAWIGNLIFLRRKKEGRIEKISSIRWFSYIETGKNYSWENSEIESIASASLPS